jgi:hypothetical protein
LDNYFLHTVVAAQSMEGDVQHPKFFYVKTTPPISPLNITKSLEILLTIHHRWAGPGRRNPKKAGTTQGARTAPKPLNKTHQAAVAQPCTPPDALAAQTQSPRD